MAPVEGEKRHETFDIANRSRDYVPLEQFSVEPGKFKKIEDLPPAEFSIHCEEEDGKGFITFSKDTQYVIIRRYRNRENPIGILEKPQYLAFSGDEILVVSDRIHEIEIMLNHKPGPQQPPKQLPPGGRDSVRV